MIRSVSLYVVESIGDDVVLNDDVLQLVSVGRIHLNSGHDVAEAVEVQSRLLAAVNLHRVVSVSTYYLLSL